GWSGRDRRRAAPPGGASRSGRGRRNRRRTGGGTRVGKWRPGRGGGEGRSYATRSVSGDGGRGGRGGGSIPDAYHHRNLRGMLPGFPAGRMGTGFTTKARRAQRQTQRNPDDTRDRSVVRATHPASPRRGRSGDCAPGVPDGAW